MLVACTLSDELVCPWVGRDADADVDADLTP